MMNSHLSSSEQSKGFDQLAEPVRRWIWNKGWNSLRDIQERAIPILLNDDRDVIIAAATAGGKTEAVFLPLISSILEQPRRGRFRPCLCWPSPGAHQRPVRASGRPLRSGRITGLSVAWRHLSGCQDPRSKEPAWRFADHAGIARSSFRAARDRNSDPILEHPYDCHR